MMRQPAVAGQFYPGSAAALEREVRRHLAKAPPRREKPTLLAMLPHAGYVYSGETAGITAGQANLADAILLLGPNHTGMGAPLAVWDRGQWLTPMGPMDVDEDLAGELVAADARLTPDFMAHMREHSLEVLAPFLMAVNPGVKAVPVCVAENRLSELSGVARSIASALKGREKPVSIVVSSDMSHFVSHDRAKELDALALEAVLRLDPSGLHAVVRDNGITMCGVLPMTLGLMIALELGAKKALLADYSTSAEASGDYGRVVGYAGVLVE
jgi:hypothetical protein